MYKGIYIALSGAILKNRNMQIFAQNIANANTPGFKKDRISFRDYIIPVDNKPPGVEDSRVMTELDEVTTDFSSGTLMRTGNPLDVAISGEGFFALEGNLYTRNGSFRIDEEGNLVTLDGIKVLGDGGPVSIQGTKIEIDSSGEIFVDGVSTGRLKIVDFSDRGVLRKAAGGAFFTESAGQESGARVSQGYLEASNVEVIKELVQMIETQREFESYQKIIQSFDDAASKTINEMGR
jgi:flagellar basal-body rod protein FlgG